MKPKLSAREIFRSMIGEGRPIHCQEDVRNTTTFRHIRDACDLTEAGQPGGISLDDFSIREMFSTLVRNRSDGQPVGQAFIQEFCDPMNPIGYSRMYEAGGAMAAVDYSMFSTIMGQLAITRVLTGFNSEDFTASALIPTVGSRLEQERWPGVALPRDPDSDGDEDVSEVAEGDLYPTVGFGAEYIQTPMTKKHGFIIPVTREAIFFDRTGLISQRAGKVGYLLGLRKEKRLLGAMIGGPSAPKHVEQRQFDSGPVTLDLFQYSQGTGQYQLASAYPKRLFPFFNEVPNNPLDDYTSIRAGDIAFAKSVDPNTGEPISVGKPFVFISRTRMIDIVQALMATGIFKISQGGLNTAGAVLTQSPNPITAALGAIEFKTSQRLRNEIVQQLYGGTDDGSADKVWFMGDPREAFAYMENWPITVTQAPPSSEAEFMQDILLRFKASERGTVAIVEPRQWQRHNFQNQG